MLKNFLVCPNCQETRGWKGSGYNVEKVNFFTFVLGEILDNGDVLIKKGGNKVRIAGKDFSVICDFCGTEVFKREEEYGTNSNQWYGRLHWESFSGTILGTN